jgi:hypothetical protein
MASPEAKTAKKRKKKWQDIHYVHGEKERNQKD